MRQLFGSISLYLLIVVFLGGCSQKTQNGSGATGSSDLKPASAHGSGGGPAMSGADLQFTAPEGWESETPTSSMRKAQYRLPRVSGDSEDAEMVVFFFRGGGGGVQANIDRWIGQFTKADGSPANDIAKISHKSSHGIPLTIVEVSGTYMSAMGPMLSEKQAKPEYRLLAAVAEASSGPWFFKLTGPAKTVGKWQASFYTFLDSIHQ